MFEICMILVKELRKLNEIDESISSQLSKQKPKINTKSNSQKNTKIAD